MNGRDFQNAILSQHHPHVHVVGGSCVLTHISTLLTQTSADMIEGRAATVKERASNKQSSRFMAVEVPFCNAIAMHSMACKYFWRNLVKRSLLILFLVGVLSPCCQAKDRVDFKTQIAPIFESHCLRCHNAKTKKGDLSLVTQKDLREAEHVVPGKPGESDLLELLVAEEGKRPAMPKKGEVLSLKQVALISRWIKEGAHWPKEIALKDTSRADKTWWSLQAIRKISPPAPQGIPETWKKNPIDRFIFRRLQEKGLRPSPTADKRTLIRRATYDLTGLPPTPEEVNKFVSDNSTDAYEKLIDRLLASPHYGEHWGRHWLDVIRFGESTGFERNVIVNNLWPFRDYIIRSFNDDKPFKRLIEEHLAGDALDAGDPNVSVGTAFLVSGPYDDVGNQDPVAAAQIRANTIDEMIRATSETFLGMTLGCARCHDHKFDPLYQKDYYSLYATFAGVRHGSRTVASAKQIASQNNTLNPLHNKRRALNKQQADIINAVFARANKKSKEYAARWVRPATSRYLTVDQFPPTRAKYVRLTVSALDTTPHSYSGFRIDEFEAWTTGKNSRNVAAVKNGGKATGTNNVPGDFAEAYSPNLTIDGKFDPRWISTGNQLTITFAKPETINRVIFSSDRLKSLGRHAITLFIGEYRLESSLDGKHWSELASSATRKPSSKGHRRERLIQLEITNIEKQKIATIKKEYAEASRQIAAVKPLPVWWVGTFHPSPGPFHVFRGGNPQKKTDVVVPASLTVLNAVSTTYKLDAKANEQQRRLKLAEWIASDSNPLTPRVLVNRIWHYHFGTGIVDTPSDFGYMGGRPTHPQLLDWLANRLLENGWKIKSLHRLIMLSQTYRQAATYRPQAVKKDADSRFLWRFPPRRLSAEEIRDSILSVTGKLQKKMGGPGFRLYKYLQDNVATYVPLDAPGPETYRRSVYHQNARAARVDLMSEFDCPDNAFATPRRATTTTPLQALTMLNHGFTLDMSKFLAERVKREAGTSSEKQIARIFALVYQRKPSAEELAVSKKFVERQGLKAFCRVIFNTSELIYLN